MIMDTLPAVEINMLHSISNHFVAFYQTTAISGFHLLYCSRVIHLPVSPSFKTCLFKNIIIPVVLAAFHALCQLAQNDGGHSNMLISRN